jgi:hypothetical protein
LFRRAGGVPEYDDPPGVAAEFGRATRQVRWLFRRAGGVREHDDPPGVAAEFGTLAPSRAIPAAIVGAWRLPS